jgi:RNA polymerase I-specific transcription initiation factor RRN3
MRVLVATFRDTPKDVTQRIARLKLSIDPTQEQISERLSATQQHAIDALIHITDIAPTQTLHLVEIIRERFPHMRHARQTQVCYLRCVLNLCLRVERLVSEVFGLIIEKLVQIDAEIKDDDDDEDDDDEDDHDSDGSDSNDEPEQEEMFTLEMDTAPVARSVAARAIQRSQGSSLSVGSYSDADLPSGNELSFSDNEMGGSDTDSESGQASSKIKAVDPEKFARQEKDPKHVLDAMMILVFEFIKYRFTLEEEKMVSMFEDLWNQFTRVILPTYRSKHVQYLIFFATRFDRGSLLSSFRLIL